MKKATIYREEPISDPERILDQNHGELTFAERVITKIFMLDEPLMRTIRGADRNLLKYQALLLLIPATTSALGMYVMLVSTETAHGVAIVIAVIWATFIVLIDIGFVSASLRSSSRVGLAFRVLAALVFSTVVATTLEMAILGDAIDNALLEEKYTAQQQLKQQLQKDREDLITNDPTLLNGRDRVQQATRALEYAREIENRERKEQQAMETKWMDEAERGGCKDICKALKQAAFNHKREDLAKAIQAREDAEAAKRGLDAELEGKLRRTTDRVDGDASSQRTELSNLHEAHQSGFLTRLETLHELAHEDWSILLIVLFVKCFFVMIEILPVAFKQSCRSTFVDKFDVVFESEKEATEQYWGEYLKKNILVHNVEALKLLERREREARSNEVIDQMRSLFKSTDKMMSIMSYELPSAEEERIKRNVYDRLHDISELGGLEDTTERAQRSEPPVFEQEMLSEHVTKHQAS